MLNCCVSVCVRLFSFVVVVVAVVAVAVDGNVVDLVSAKLGP